MSRWQVAFLRAALLWLIATGAVGLYGTIDPAFSALFRPTHAHMGLVGFLIAMVMGVAFWMMPRPGGIRQTTLEPLTFFLLQGGLILRVIGEPWWRRGGGAAAHSLFIASGVLLLASMITFGYAMSKRVVTIEVIRELGQGRRRPLREREQAASSDESES